jgi:hypothetical protein
MPSPRRSAVFAVLVLLAGLVFAGCGRAQPGTAAYVGTFRITEKHIDAMVDEVRRSAPNRTPDGIRILVVSTLVLSELAEKAARENSIQVPSPAYDEVARSTGLPADSDLVRAIAELDAAGGALIEKATPVQPTDRDVRAIYDGLMSSQSIPDSTTFEDAAQQIRSNASLPGVLGARELLLEQAEKIGLDVNPRYRPLTASIGTIGVPMVLADGIGVRDRTQGSA